LKKFILILLLGSILFSSDIKTEEKIYALIIHTLLPNKTVIKVWCDQDKEKRLLRLIPNIKFISNAQDADFLLLSHSQKIKTKGIKFVTNFNLLEEGKKSVVGGFFWQKGRPNILFLRKNLQKHNISLPDSMQEYVEDEI
jgi:hypothetical protein